MGKKDGRQKGPQQHAEGQHGGKTHAKLVEQLQAGSRRGEYVPNELEGHPSVGRHRLAEDRQQHDEAEKNSEKNRLLRELDKANLDQNESDIPSIKGGREKRVDAQG
jgi:hypothetical protein